MLSQNWNSQDTVSRVANILKEENISIWFDKNGDMKDSMYEKYAHEANHCIFLLYKYNFSVALLLE